MNDETRRAAAESGAEGRCARPRARRACGGGTGGCCGPFVLLVLLPSAAISFYLWVVAEDRYASVAGFTVRQEETGGATELLGGLGALTGSNLSADGDILYEFILSQAMVRALDAELDLRAHFAEHWPSLTRSSRSGRRPASRTSNGSGGASCGCPMTRNRG